MTRLGDVCQIKYGKDHKSIPDGDYPVFGSGGIMRHCSKYLSEGPSVLIPRKGSLGNVFYSESRFWTVDTLFWTKIDTAKVEPRYLYYALKDKHLERLNVGTAVPSLTVEVLNEVELDILPVEEQRKMLSLISPLDDQVDNLNRTNGYLADCCDAMYKRLFSGLEENATLSDIADVTMGQSPSSASYNEDGAGAVFYQGRGEFGWRFPTRRLYTTEPKRMAKTGDVLMSVRAPVGDLNIAEEDCCIGRGLAAISARYSSFCLYLMRSLKSKLDVYNGEGTVFGSINRKELKGLSIAVPSKGKIEHFERFASTIDRAILNNTREIRKLEQLRDTLLPKLMSGEIDVSEVELPTPPNSHLCE